MCAPRQNPIHRSMPQRRRADTGQRAPSRNRSTAVRSPSQGMCSPVRGPAAVPPPSPAAMAVSLDLAVAGLEKRERRTNRKKEGSPTRFLGHRRPSLPSSVDRRPRVLLRLLPVPPRWKPPRVSLIRVRQEEGGKRERGEEQASASRRQQRRSLPP
jgi:hypothetical protein